MKCSNEDIQILLDDYLRNELGAKDKSVVEEHLKICEDCRDFKRHLELAATSVKQFVVEEAEKHISAETMLTYADSPHNIGKSVAKTIKTHLIVCDSCRAWHDDLRRIPPEPPSDPEPKPSVVEKLFEQFRSTWFVFKRPSYAYATAASAALVLLIWSLIPGAARLELVKNSVARSELTAGDKPRNGSFFRSSFSTAQPAAINIMQELLEGTRFEYERVSDAVLLNPNSGVSSPLLRFVDSSGVVLDEFQSFAHDSASGSPSDWKAWVLTLPSRDLYSVDLDTDTCAVIWPKEIDRKGLIAFTHRSGKNQWPTLGRKFPTADPNTLLKQADNLIARGEFTRADTSLDRAIDIWEQENGPDYVPLASCLELKSELSRRQSDEPDAVMQLLRACQIRLRDFYKNASGKTVTEVYSESIQLRKYRDRLLALYMDVEIVDSSISRGIADLCLSVKGITSEHERRLQHLVRRPPNFEVKRIASHLAVDLSNLGSILANSPFTESMLTGEDESHPDIDSIHSRYRTVESRLADQAGKYIEYRDNITSSKLASCLPQSTVFIDFSVVRSMTTGHSQGISRYAATVVNDHNQVWLVPLGRTSVIDSLAVELQRHMVSVASKTSWASMGDLARYLDIARRLYQEAFEPLEETITDERLVIVAPDGPLWLVPFDALVDAEDQYLIDRISMHYVSASRDIIYDDFYRPRHPVKGKGMIAVSGEGETTGVDGDGRPFPDYSLEETLSAVGKWDDIATVLIDSNATRSEFIQQTPRKKAIHLPLHGFMSGHLRAKLLRNWQPIEVDLPFDMDFLLTGAYLYDGVLRGSEVTRLPLEGVDLAILDLCNSATGNIRLGEGNRGFSRAFQLAGVNTVVGALWDIPDQSSAEITPGLLKTESGTLPDRLRQEKLKLRRELLRDNDGRNDHPYYWAGLVSMGGW